MPSTSETKTRHKPSLLDVGEAEAGVAGTVLLIDDDPILAEMYRLALQRAGYDTLIAHDGPQGLLSAASGDPDIILLDIRMPRMDGIEVLRRLAADPDTRAIPVVMLSNYDDPYLIRTSLALGAKEYLVKTGVDPRKLPAIVARWLTQAP